MIIGQISFILYTQLDFPSSTELFLPKNVKQSVHLDSSITAGNFEGIVTPGQGSHVEKNRYYDYL